MTDEENVLRFRHFGIYCSSKFCFVFYPRLKTNVRKGTSILQVAGYNSHPYPLYPYPTVRPTVHVQRRNMSHACSCSCYASPRCSKAGNLPTRTMKGLLVMGTALASTRCGNRFYVPRRTGDRKASPRLNCKLLPVHGRRYRHASPKL